MKLYDSRTSPNPRRVRIFLAEKGIAVEKIAVNLAEREQLTPAYRAINSRCVVPTLVLDDGTALGEVPAICRYIEETHPEPPLFGRTPRERAVVAMWERRMELEGLFPGMELLRNANPAMKDRAITGPRNYGQIAALAERARARLADFFDDLDARLAETPFVAGESFSCADITAVVAIDFAAKRSGVTMPEGLPALARWYAEVSARPSMDA